MTEIRKLYSDFIDIAIAKELNIQYDLTLNGNDKFYMLFAVDSAIDYVCHINSIDNSASVVDFESNHKDNSNQPISCVPEFKRRMKIYSDFTEKELSCTDTDWTLFYSKEFTASNIYFQELLMKFYHDHIVRVDIDGVTVCEISVKDIDDFFVIEGETTGTTYAGNTITMFFLDSTYDWVLGLSLANFKGTKVDVYMKHRTGTGNLRMNGIILSYKE